MIFKVMCKIPPTQEHQGVERVRLVEAPKLSTAMKYVASDWLTITPLTTAEAVELGAAGIKVEQVNGRPE